MLYEIIFLKYIFKKKSFKGLFYLNINLLVNFIVFFGKIIKCEMIMMLENILYMIEFDFFCLYGEVRGFFIVCRK